MFTLAPGRGVRVAGVRPAQQVHMMGPVHAALRQQQEAVRREAERVHQREQLQASLTLPAPPLVSFSEEEGRVELSWQPLSVPDGEVQYSVSMSSDVGVEEVYKGHMTSCCLSPGLLPGHQYKFSVTANSSGETGRPSEGATVSVPARVPSPPPRPKVAVKTKGSVTLRWNAASPNGAALTGYSLEWDQCCGQWVELYQDKAKQFKFTYRFAPASSAHFRVRACNAVGWSEFSEVLEFVSGAGPPASPLPPSLVTAHPHSLTLHWSPPVDHGSPITSYQLDMEAPQTGYGFRPVYHGEELEYTCTGLARHTVYSFRLAASNDAGQGPFSSVVALATLAELPGAVSLPSLKERATPTSFNILWAEPADCGGVPLTAYVLQLAARSTGDLEDVYTGLETSYLATDLQPGIEYQCRVCAVSSVGRGEWSPVAHFKTAATKPHPPASVSVLGRPTQTSVQLKWGPPLSYGGTEIDSYYIEGCEGGEGGRWSVLASGCPHTRHTLTHLSPGTCYQLRVCARNSVGASEPSAVCECVTASAAADPPQSLSLKLSGSSATLLWQASVTHGTAVRSYEVEHWGGGSPSEKRVTSSTTSTTLTLHNLSPASHYQARVRALSAAGDSTWTWPITFSTAPSHPSPPSHITVVTRTPHCLLISWGVPNCNGAPISAYHVQVSGQVTDYVTDASETQCTVSGLEPSTSYRVRVCAENAVGLGSYSGYCSGSTLPSPPSSPHISLTSSSAHNLRLSWARKPAHGLEYLLHMRAPGKEFCELYRGTAAGHRLAKLAPASSYCFRIAAISESGQGVWSDHVTFETTPLPPAAPIDVLCERVSADRLQVSWAVAATPYPLPLSYELQLKLAGDFEQVYRGGSSSFTVSMATDCDATPQCRVRALACCHANDRDEQLWSPYSEVVCASPSPLLARADPAGSPTPSLTAAVAEQEGRAHPPPKPILLQKSWLLFALGAVLSLLLAVLLGAYLI